MLRCLLKRSFTSTRNESSTVSPSYTTVNLKSPASVEDIFQKNTSRVGACAPEINFVNKHSMYRRGNGEDQADEMAGDLPDTLN